MAISPGGILEWHATSGDDFLYCSVAWRSTVWQRPGSYANLRVRLGLRKRVQAYRSGRSAAWLARLVRDQEVDGSNPFAPTI